MNDEEINLRMAEIAVEIKVSSTIENLSLLGECPLCLCAVFADSAFKHLERAHVQEMSCRQAHPTAGVYHPDGHRVLQ